MKLEQMGPKLTAAGAGLLISGSSWYAICNGFDVDHLQKVLRQAPSVPLLFLTLHIGVSLLFLPRAAMAIVAGLIFGFWKGLLWATIGCALGGLVGFLSARYFRDSVPSPSAQSRLRGLVLNVERGSWRAVMMIRLIPVIPHSLTNYALGLTDLSTGAYITGSLIGQLPMTVAFVQFGAAGTQLIEGKPSWIQPTLYGLAILAASAMLPNIFGGKDGRSFGRLCGRFERRFRLTNPPINAALAEPEACKQVSDPA